MKIVFVIGTKAELIKCMPLMLELQKQKRDYLFIHTGQHPLGKSIEKFGLKKPDYILTKEPKKGTKLKSKAELSSWKWFIKLIFKIKKLLKKINPDYVLYHGDTISTGAAAIGSSWILNPFKKWKNVHLEAGLRSGSLFEPFPEEIVRQVADRFSDILLAVSDRSVRNLKRERISLVLGKIIKVGNTIIDSAKITYEKTRNKYKKYNYEYALINIHRHENLKSKERMKKIIEILKSIKIKALWPLHDVTIIYLKKYGFFNEVKQMKNIKIMPALEYSQFIFLLANCKYLVVDGGSIQEESLIFKKPCLLLRKKTERQEGLSTGINFLTKLNINYSKHIIEKIENNKIKIKNFKNPYGEKGIILKILNILK